jgi:hypothetical protein
MKSIWQGFEKQASLWDAGKGFIQKMAPKAQAAWQKAKPVMQSAAAKGQTLASKAKTEVMKTPQRALGAGLAAGAGGGYLMSKQRETPMQSGAQAAYY